MKSRKLVQVLVRGFYDNEYCRVILITLEGLASAEPFTSGRLYFMKLKLGRITDTYGFTKMMVVGSVIARLGSKRLPYKNLLPFRGIPLVRLGVLKLLESKSVDTVVLSTESELIARQVEDLDVIILRRPDELSSDNIPSIPVFKHIVACLPCDVHVNYNINFPNTDPLVIDRAVEAARSHAGGESLSNPYAVWAQTSCCLENYGDPWNITAEVFNDERVVGPDIHTEDDLMASHRKINPKFEKWWKASG